MWEKDEGVMREEAKCLKIKAHFGETRGSISTESVCATPSLALHSRVLDVSGRRRLTLGEYAMLKLTLSTYCFHIKLLAYSYIKHMLVRVTFKGTVNMLTCSFLTVSVRFGTVS